MKSFFTGILRVLILGVIVSFAVSYCDAYSNKKNQEKKELLKSCGEKFQYSDEYYAACPYGKNIELTYHEYIELDATVQAVSEQFELDKKSSEKLNLIFKVIGLVIFMGIVAICYFKFRTLIK